VSRQATAGVRADDLRETRFAMRSPFRLTFGRTGGETSRIASERTNAMISRLNQSAFAQNLHRFTFETLTEGTAALSMPNRRGSIALFLRTLEQQPAYRPEPVVDRDASYWSALQDDADWDGGVLA